MKEDVTQVLLNGMTIPFFIAMLILALAGVIVFFIREIIRAMKYDKRTPEKFDFKTMFKMSALRILASLIIIPITIIYFGDMSRIVFGIAEPLQMNGFVAFLLGMSIDRLVDGVLGWGKDGGLYIVNQTRKIINNH